MKQKQFARRLGSLLMCLLCLTLIINLLWPDNKESTIENRSLQQFPTVSLQSLSDGSFQSNLSSWFSDQLVGRNLWIQGRYVFLKLTQNKKIDDVFLAKNQLIQDSSKPDTKQMDRNLKAINAFAQSSGLPTSFVLVPTAVSVQSDRIDSRAVAYDQSKMMDQIYAKLDGSIQKTDLRSVLKKHRSEYIYYRTDHHWTSLGAFYAAQALYGDQKKNYKELLVSNTFQGTLAHKTGSVGIGDSISIFVPKQKLDYLVTNEDDGSKSRTWYHSKAIASNDQYAVFGNGNHALMRLEMDNDQTGHLLLIKDSYANALIPFLLEHYKTITIVDPRYYYGDLNQLVQQDTIDSVMYVYNANTFVEDHSLADCLP